MKSLPLAAALLLTAPLTLHAQPFGIETRAENTALLINSLPSDQPGTMQLERVFAPLNFTQPVLMLEAPDGSGRMFVVERTGRIWTFPRADNLEASDKQLFLNLSQDVRTDSEHGLLGLAFSPDFATDGEFYVCYSPDSGARRTRVSRFTNANPSDNAAVPASEEVIIEFSQPADNHNGGMIAFGPDGMLYIGLGDGGGSNDQFNQAQDTRTLLGSMVRIDVAGTPDPGLNYRIPPDNPFVNGGPAGDQTRREIWAYGLRNPWRFSFDQMTGALMVADVGQGCWEEVDVINKGGNYGWPRMEGNVCFVAGQPCSTNVGSCSTLGLARPIAVYDRSNGQSITGGFTSYSSRVPDLYGMFIYADYVSGRIWGLRHLNGVTTGPFVLTSSAGFNITGFGQDADGEVYVLNFGAGTIHRLVPTSPEPDAFPTRLSDIPALLAAGKGEDQTAQGIIPYRPSTELWSDNTHKSRFMALPGLTQATWTPVDGLEFPEETVLIKNFVMPLDDRDPENSLKRLETRLMFHKNGTWHGFSYEWNEEETDAVLLTTSRRRPLTITRADGSTLEYEWYYPSRNDCRQCHVPDVAEVLGISSGLLNSDFGYPASGVEANQLATLDHIGFFDAALPAPVAELPRIPDAKDPADGTLEERARAYFVSNCAFCHRPDGPAPVNIDLRWETLLENTNTVGVRPQSIDLGYHDPYIINPGRPFQSVLLGRMSDRGSFAQMPPIATSRVDEVGRDLIRDWIQSLPPLPTPGGWVAY
jgi:uncharacterized repeat protein (TIGR03806 family)